MKKVVFILLFISFFSGNLLAQKLDGNSIYIDFTKFRNDSNSVFVELYYSIVLNALKKVNEEGIIDVKSDITVEVFKDSADIKLAEKNIKIKSIVDPEEKNTENKFVTGQKAFIMTPGDYRFRFFIKDIHDSLNFYKFELPVKITGIDNSKPNISGIQMCSNIIENSENKSSYFYKNTYEVIPNPSLIYGEGLPNLYYYLELYNLNKSRPEAVLNFVINVTDSQGKVKIKKQKIVSRKYNSIVEVGAVNISKLVSGTYNFIVGLIDTTTGDGVISSKKFFVYNSQVKDSSTARTDESSFLSSEFAVMDEAEINSKFEIGKYIATNDEIKQWEKLDNLDAKRKFLYSFWQSRNPDFTSPVNLYKEQYYKRAEYANLNYSSGKNPGWKSDRGRIYLVYGEPSEIERFPNEMDSYPYEIWHYNQLEGGSVFVFGDLTGFSQMTLLHSTYRGELRDDNWYARLKKSK